MLCLAILPDHVHLLIRKHRDPAEEIILHFQRNARLRLSETKSLPEEHPTWTRSGFRGFLDNPNAVRSVIRYIEQNPVKAGNPPQKWEFVTPYNGWPFHKPGAK